MSDEQKMPDHADLIKRLHNFLDYGPHPKTHNQCVAEAVTAIATLTAENERLQAIVDKLPKTADGVPVVLGVTRVYTVWDWSGEMSEGVVFSMTVGINLESKPHFRVRWERDGKCTGDRQLPASKCYSTREAAEATQLKEQDDDK